MKKSIAGVSGMGLALLLAVAVADGASGEEPSTICQLCGMDAALSETEFVLHLKDEPATHACCINCTRRLIKKLGGAVTAVTTLDYRTREQTPAHGAFYVMGGKRIPKGSMTPFVFGFAKREDAEHFRKQHGGEVLGFDDVVRRIEQSPQ
jgi:nitrous oxide reductase accessory protein NosL